MKTILTPIDFSTITQAVIDESVRLAESVNGTIILLHVVTPAPPAPNAAALALLIDMQALEKSERKRALVRLKSIKKKLMARFLTAEVECLIGQPGKSILSYSEKIKADYLVIGSRGHSSFYDLVVGSTAQLILRRSHCPVLVIPPKFESAHAVSADTDVGEENPSTFKLERTS